MRIAHVLAAVALSFAFPSCKTSHHDVAANDAPAATNALPAGQVVGEPMTPGEVRRLSVVDGQRAKLVGEPILVEGVVKEICAKRSCWTRIEDEGKSTVVRWESGCGVSVFPAESLNKRVLVEGKFVEQKAAANAPADAEKKYLFMATSMLILDEKS